MKFRYVFKNKHNKVKFLFLNIKEIEKFDLVDYAKQQEETGWYLISRDRYTGLTDEQNYPIYEGDVFYDGGVVRYSNGKNEYAGMAVGFVLEYRDGESWTYLGEDNSHKWSVVVGSVHDKESDVG